MINSLITSQTRIKLLKKFFLNCNTMAHLRGLEAEFGDSSNSIRIELNRLESAGLLGSVRQGNKKLYKANRNQPLFDELYSIILKDSGLDKLIEKVVDRIGKLYFVYLTGDFARGIDSKMIELILVGEEIDRDYLAKKVAKAEQIVGRKVNYVLLSRSEAKEMLKQTNPCLLLPLWNIEAERIK
jgi:hypothetical protein